MITAVKFSLQIKIRERETNRLIGSLPFVRVINVTEELSTVDLINEEVQNILKGVISSYLKDKGISNRVVMIETHGEPSYIY